MARARIRKTGPSVPLALVIRHEPRPVAFPAPARLDLSVRSIRGRTAVAAAVADRRRPRHGSIRNRSVWWMWQLHFWASFGICICPCTIVYTRFVPGLAWPCLAWPQCIPGCIYGMCRVMPQGCPGTRDERSLCFIAFHPPLFFFPPRIDACSLNVASGQQRLCKRRTEQ